MMTNDTSVLRKAIGLLSARWIAMQIGLALLVFALAVAWLRVPDASAADIAGTVVLGLAVLALAGGGEALLLLWLCQQRVTRRRLAVGGLLLLGGLLLWLGWSALLGHAAENDPTWAGYLNSRFSHGLRNVFSYSHLLLWFGWFWVLLQWAGAGALAAVAAGMVAGSYPKRAIRRALGSFVYWGSLLVCAGFAVNVTGWLANWTPGHGLVVEALSLALRLAALLLLDGAVAGLMFAVLAAHIVRSDAASRAAAYEAEAGTPDKSQTRTVAKP